MNSGLSLAKAHDLIKASPVNFSLSVAIVGISVALGYYIFNRKYGKSKIPPKIYVSSLYLYPLKGARGLQMKEISVNAFGFKYDRQWMIVSSETLRAQTQRQFPKIALIIPEITNTELILTAPDIQPLKLRLNSNSAKQEVTVGLWEDNIVVWDEGEEASTWATKYVGIPCKIVRMKNKHTRPILEYKVPGAKNECSLADGYPFLLANTVSMEDLNARLVKNSSSPLSITRFRPNIIVSGIVSAWEEDFWEIIKVGLIKFHIAKPCSRCKVPTIDQFTSTLGEEPTKTLNTFRKSKKGVFFGTNLIHEKYNGTVKVGDPVVIEKILDIPHELIAEFAKKEVK